MTRLLRPDAKGPSLPSGVETACRRALARSPSFGPFGAALVAVVLAAAAHDADAQTLEERCRSAGGVALSCAAAADAVEIVPARALLIAGGGNPVAGTASTLGFRVPGTPRIGITARTTGASIETPAPAAPSASRSSMALGINADVAIAVFDGLPAGPTVGGVLSLDAIASVGVVRMPGGFNERTPITWALGARAGILRESFTVPGISLTAMYRRLGEVGLGNAAGADAWDASMSGLSAWTLTGAIGKRIALFGFTAGAAWSHRSGEASVLADSPLAQPAAVAGHSFDGSRVSAFGNITWTLTVVGLSAELGWQSAGDALTSGRAPASDASAGGFFFGLAARLTI